MTDAPEQPVEKKQPLAPQVDAVPEQPKKAEVGGRQGLEPTRYGDWEHKGIAVDF